MECSIGDRWRNKALLVYRQKIGKLQAFLALEREEDAKQTYGFSFIAAVSS